MKALIIVAALAIIFLLAVNAGSGSDDHTTKDQTQVEQGLDRIDAVRQSLTQQAHDQLSNDAQNSADWLHEFAQGATGQQ